ncbi:MAG: hypothetical protein HY606_05065 [Planctomycetes bacterium]|nr:hypothetical protein [Planctomycetota bacterium]
MGYVGNPKTTYNRIPFEKSVYMQNGRMGVKNIKPASLFGGIYQHNNAGSLDDWEHIDTTRALIDLFVDTIGGDYSYYLWAGGMNDWFGAYQANTSVKLVDLVDAPDTRGAAHTDGRKHHAIDLEIFSNTGTLNHNLHTHGLSSASGVNKSALMPRKNYLEAHRWAHVMWSWYIKFNRKPIEVLPAGRILTFDTGTLGYAEIPTYAAEHEMKIFVNGIEVEGSGKIPAESSVISRIDQRLWMKGGRRPVFSLNSWSDADAVSIDGSDVLGANVSGSTNGGQSSAPIGANSSTGSNNLVANVLRIGESMFNGFTFNRAAYLKGNVDKCMWPRNYSGDYTVDELYVHGSAEVNDQTRKGHLDKITNAVKGVYQKGRYYVPKGEECRFESGEVRLENFGRKPLAETARVFESDNRSGVLNTLTQKNIKLMGMQWTWYGEDWDRDTGEEVMYDYKDYSTQQQHNGKVKGGAVLRQGIESEEGAAVRADLVVVGEGGVEKETFQGKDSGYTAIDQKGRKYYELKEKENVKYRVVFKVRGATSGTTLLATPVFDDVTIFFSEGIKIMSYNASE